MSIENNTLTVYYDMQCPFIPQYIEKLKHYCNENDIPADFILVDSLEKAKELPCVFNNWGTFYKGKFDNVNLLNVAKLEKMLKKL